jgi:hypothetical protein
MRLFFAMAVLLTGCTLPGLASPGMLTVIEQNGAAYIPTSELDRQADIAVKALPGDNAMVVCFGGCCALVRDWFRRDNEIWLSTTALEKTLGLIPQFSADRRSVRLEPGRTELEAAAGPARVGQLAPNFRLALLGGGSVSLADFRGKRVLINSWASW